MKNAVLLHKLMMASRYGSIDNTCKDIAVETLQSIAAKIEMCCLVDKPPKFVQQEEFSPLLESIYNKAKEFKQVSQTAVPLHAVEVGKRYRTKDGSFATILGYVPEELDEFFYIGYVTTFCHAEGEQYTNSFHSWDIQGNAYENSEINDLILEIK